MLALDYEVAKKVAIGLVLLLVVLSIVSAIVIKNITVKIVTTLVLVGLSLGVWTQRESLQDCAQNAQTRAELGATVGLTCTFFNTEVTIVDPEE